MEYRPWEWGGGRGGAGRGEESIEDLQGGMGTDLQGGKWKWAQLSRGNGHRSPGEMGTDLQGKWVQISRGNGYRSPGEMGTDLQVQYTYMIWATVSNPSHLRNTVLPSMSLWESENVVE